MFTIEELIQAVAANNHTDIISHLIKTKAGLGWEEVESVTVEVYSQYLTEELKATANSRGYVTMDLKVIKFNPLCISEPYFVQMPNGQYKWVSNIHTAKTRNY